MASSPISSETDPGKILAQQQNPHAVSYSLQQQQIDSQEINSEAEADVKTFSIRQYAFACRQRSLLQSWPFAEKYLQMCFDRGLRNVLPPFGLRDNNNNNNNSSVSESSHNAIPNLNDPSDEDYYDDKNVKVLKSESSPDHHHNPLELMKKQNVMNHGDSGFSLFDEAISKARTSLLPEEGMISAPPDCVKKSSHILNCCSSKSSSGKLDRRRRRKGRCKKRSMADILAVANRCTLEEIYRINRFSYAAATGNIIEGYRHETATLHENDPKSTERDDHGVANFHVNVTCTN